MVNVWCCHLRSSGNRRLYATFAEILLLLNLQLSINLPLLIEVILINTKDRFDKKHRLINFVLVNSIRSENYPNIFFSKLTKKTCVYALEAPQRSFECPQYMFFMD